MSDLISRQDAIDKIREVYEYEFPTASGEFDEFVVMIIPNILRNLPSAEPDNQVHLCGFCKYDYPECTAEMSDIIFGNGIGHDNVCACAKFEIKPERKKGKWKPDESGNVYWICSACGFASEAFIADMLYHFCPHCGCDMRGNHE